jgi:hypothetical protein
LAWVPRRSPRRKAILSSVEFLIYAARHVLAGPVLKN